MLGMLAAVCMWDRLEGSPYRSSSYALGRRPGEMFDLYAYGGRHAGGET